MDKKEFAIGERFQCGMVTLECVEDLSTITCYGCYFDKCLNGCASTDINLPLICDALDRSDHKNVIFKQVRDNETE